MKKRKIMTAAFAAALLASTMISGCGSNQAAANNDAQLMSMDEPRDDAAQITSVVVPEEEGKDVEDPVLAKEKQEEQARLTEEALQLQGAMDAQITEQALLTEQAQLTEQARLTEAAKEAATPTPIDAGKKDTPVPTQTPEEVKATPTPKPQAPAKEGSTPTPIVAGKPSPEALKKNSSDTGNVTIIIYAPDGSVLSGARMTITICDEVGNPKTYSGYPCTANGKATVPYDKTVFNRIKVYTELPAGYYFGDDTGFPISDYNFLTAYLVDGQWYDGAKISGSGLSVYVWNE